MVNPLFNLNLLANCLKNVGRNYLHTALDTCGHTTTPEGLKALEEADLVLYDVKGLNSIEHARNTGVSNEIILNNLKRLNEIAKPIIIRIPLIPGHNDSFNSLDGMAKLLSGLKSVERVDLLAYHKFGTIKYAQLGRNYALNIDSPNPKRMNDIMALFQKCGLRVQLGG